MIIMITSNVPAPRAGTFTPAQRPYRGCSVLRYYHCYYYYYYYYY